jgi:hypothetical protein
MNARAAFAIAYRAVRMANPHSGSTGRHVHPYRVRSLVYAAAGAVRGRPLPAPDDRLVIDHREPLASLQWAHRSVLQAHGYRVSLSNGEIPRGYDVKTALQWIDKAICEAWSGLAFYRHKRGNSDLWEIHLACRGSRTLLRTAWAESRAGVEGPATLAIRILRKNSGMNPEHALLAAEGLLASRGAA